MGNLIGIFVRKLLDICTICGFNEYFSDWFVGGIVVGICSILGIGLNRMMKDFDKEQSLDAIRLLLIVY